MTTELLHITPIPAFADNYIWLLHNKVHAIVIDPGDASVVEPVIQQLGLKLVAICITHHHADHIGGVKSLVEQFGATVYAPRYGQYPFDHIALSDHEHLSIEALNLDFEILWLPGHTQDHIAYLYDHHLFCGDVIFAAGCGRLLDGTPEQMLSSLNRIKQLDPETELYCAHEYTSINIDFALTLEPDNQVLSKRQQDTNTMRAQGKPTIPSKLSLELKTNPFLRCTEQDIIQSANTIKTDELSVFTKIRQMRNHY